ncbi:MULTISPECIES: hypothetical protein [Buttiauxella]|uniref:hypothetical protein n=1 Tax=Buttiauxella TaxID=82976 RepID=UPI0015612692|nr:MULTISPECIES: hypothetical protein [Buttiauxella]MCS3603145.1 hypothetical protein [Buttiauxella sp. BIGb0471]BCG08173.1 hypothetical protein BADSM9389_08050 [Buttiauxella agrestis]
MKIFATIASFRTQTRIIFLACLAIATSLALYLYLPPINENQHNLVCRANLQIVRNNATFRGIIDFKAGEGKGIAHINGIIDAAPQEYTVQRTILFTHTDYGLSPVWVSRQIVISNRETVPSELLIKFLPDFYLKNSGVTDIDIFTLNKDADLITREGIPYLYCQKYLLPEDE